MNEEPTLNWAKNVLGAFSFQRHLLAWDSYECHIMQSVKEALAKMKVDQAIVPGGCTRYIQAPDVSWNKLFKALVTEQYDEWIASSVQEYTEAGNIRPPPRKTVVNWVLTAWSRLSVDVTVKYFKSCALNRAVDGSEDSNIHCFKKVQPWEGGSEQLKAKLSVLNEPSLPNPFQDITDSDIEEATENINIVDLDDDEDIDIDI